MQEKNRTYSSILTYFLQWFAWFPVSRIENQSKADHGICFRMMCIGKGCHKVYKTYELAITAMRSVSG